MKTVALIEHKNNTHSIRYSDEQVEPNFFIRQWKFVRITEQQLEEVKNATADKIESILKRLYYEV